jgi:hypothetical protein
MEIATPPSVGGTGALIVAAAALATGVALAFSGQGGSGPGDVVSQACSMLLLLLGSLGCLGPAASQRCERPAWLTIGLGPASC